jgi:hypothetical protein
MKIRNDGKRRSGESKPQNGTLEILCLPVLGTEFRLPQQPCSRQFSLLKLIHFLDSVEQDSDPEWRHFGFVLSLNQCNLDCGTDLETPRDFTSVSSDYYPGLASQHGQMIDEWYSIQEK